RKANAIKSKHSEFIFANDEPTIMPEDRFVIFADLGGRAITQKETGILSSARTVYSVDLRGFETGINIADLCQGPAAVEAKLRRLVSSAEVEAIHHPEMSVHEIAEHTVYGPTLRSRTELLGSRVNIMPCFGRSN